MTTLKSRPGASVLLAAGALLLAALVAAPQADASTIYACVKKDGTVHFVSKKAKCKKHETKLSWNSEGPAGKNGAAGANGANGTNGANGANGAVAGYFASEGLAPSNFVVLPEEVEGIHVLGKTLPAGNYLISAKVETAAEGKSSALVVNACDLRDETSNTTLDLSEWDGLLGAFEGGIFVGATTLPLQSVLSISSPHAISVQCENRFDFASSGKVIARRAQILAVQTSSIS